MSKNSEADREKKSDRRIRQRKKAVHEALLQLLEEKKLTEISIVELTERADINRKTFYNHYRDLYAVLDEIEDEWVDRLMNNLKHELQVAGRELIIDENATISQLSERISAISQPFFKTMMRELKDNADYLKILLNSDGRSKILRKIVDRDRELLRELLGERNVNYVWIDYFLTFIIDGLIAVVNQWFEDGCRTSEEEMAEFFGLIFTSGDVYRFVQGKTAPI